MARKPRIPMLPTELPQQRLYLVKGLPERPANWSITLGTQAEGLAPTAMPRSPVSRFSIRGNFGSFPMYR